METVADETKDSTKQKSLHFEHLPAFASFLLAQRLEEVIRYSLDTARRIEYPLLKYFAHMPEEQLLALSRVTQAEFLTHAINNNLGQQIEHSLQQWRENQLPLIDKDQVIGEDITMGSYLRKQVWMKFLPDYTDDSHIILGILSELDEYHMVNDAAAFSTFIKIQSEKLQVTNDALEQKEALYKQAQALTHIGNWGWSIADGKIDWSDEMYRIYGLKPQSEELTFERFVSFIHPEDRDKRVTQIQRSLQTLDPPHYVMRIIRPDGSVVVLSGKNEVIVDKNSKPVKMVGTCQDITTAYHLQESLRDANRSLESKNRELERSNKELSSFNYVASHDLQEPLRKIKTYSDLIINIEGDSLSEKGRKYFGNINSSAQRMNQLIQDLLSYSRTHNYTSDIKPVDLNTTLKEVCAPYEEQVAEKKMVLEIGKLPVVNGISFQFFQLFENLINNSVKYSKDNVTPIIKVYADIVNGNDLDLADIDGDRQYHRITVLDNGIGFSPEFNAKVFEIFQRLHNPDEYTGTGIGLAICKRIVQNHDGFILASGVPGTGSTFSIYLPV